SPPQKINRHTAQHDDKARPGSCSLIDEEHGENDAGAKDIEQGHERITESLVGAFCIGPFSSQHEDPENRKNVEDERGGDDVVEQIAIQVSVTGNCSGGVPLDRARQSEKAGPDSLHNQTP